MTKLPNTVPLGHKHITIYFLQVAQLSQRDRAARGGGALAKYKRENRASNIALSYSVDVDVDESPFYCFMSPYLYLMQNFATFIKFGSIWRFELGYFIWGFLGFFA